MTYNEACRAIIDHQDEPALNYAVNYAKAGLQFAGNSDAAVRQSLYILGNMERWRGDTAREVRATFKRVVANDGRGE